MPEIELTDAELEKVSGGLHGHHWGFGRFGFGGFGLNAPFGFGYGYSEVVAQPQVVVVPVQTQAVESAPVVQAVQTACSAQLTGTC